MIVRIYHKEQARVSRMIAAVAIALLALFAYLEFSSAGYLAGKRLITRFDVGDRVNIRDGEFSGARGEVKEVVPEGKTVRLVVALRNRDEPVTIDAAKVEQLERKKVLGILYTWGQVAGIMMVVAFAVVGYVVLNRPRIVEFFSAVETEIRKVSWPTKQQVFGSALVVIITMLVLAGYLFVVDAGLTWILRKFLHGG